MDICKVDVALVNEPYQIHIGDELLSRIDLWQSVTNHQQIVVISNDVVAPLYLSSVKQALSDRQVYEFIIADGEVNKSLVSFEQACQFLIENNIRRNALIVALGGGVVGDLSGFVAACYQRGVNFIQVPTTLLAMVDSSVGGKTAINHPSAKNMIGAFYQPKSVLIDLSVLASLPAREFSAGMAEVIKYGLVDDFSFFQYLEQHTDTILAHDQKVLAHVVAECCRIKAKIVIEDETEQSIRAILNLGHTFAHAIEKLGRYRTFLHGEAVAIGMCMAFELSTTHNLIERDYLSRLEALLLAFNLPVRVKHKYNKQDFIDIMLLDKKNKSDKITLILPVEYGRVVITDNYDRPSIIEAIAKRME
ncbi:MAG: 3-dehydroquinate synthase [Kangiellaceae bacterium]|nr:3-dehydroquinate synthase [Kangiellaceae bacterium]